MILMGDEVRHTQRGNNNTYCHDNEISWFDWSLLDKHADLHRFVKLLIARRLLRNLDSDDPGATLTELLETARCTWHGVRVGQPDWAWDSHTLAFEAELPAEGRWRRWVDTGLDSPNDIVDWQSAQTFSAKAYHAEPRSVVVLIAGLSKERTTTAQRL